MPAPKAGVKVGAKKIDAESYIPPIGDWEDTNILWDFEDGWLVVEDRSEYDRRLMAKLTLTCVAALIPQCTSDLTEADRKAIMRRTSYSYMTDAMFDREWNYIKGQYKKPGYKLGHVRDPEGRPMSCILFADAEQVRNPAKGVRLQYADSNDLGQSFGVMIDKKEWLIAELRLGTGKAGPLHVEERVIEWFQAATGKWNEEAYLNRQVTRREYAAITNHPADADLATFRRETVAA